VSLVGSLLLRGPVASPRAPMTGRPPNLSPAVPGDREPPRLILARQASALPADGASKAIGSDEETHTRPGGPAGPALPYRGCSPCRTHGRGGARNHRDRVSAGLSLSAAAGILDATDFALALGLGLNRFVSIHWEAGGITDDLAATARWLKLAGDWIRSRGGKVAYVWVRENGPGKGAHVHILMHLPPALSDPFNRLKRGWLKACGAVWKKGVLQSRPIGRDLRQFAGQGPTRLTYEANLRAVVDYILKGADEATRQALQIQRSEPGGDIIGKRCGVSQNIGPDARRRVMSAFPARDGEMTFAPTTRARGRSPQPTPETPKARKYSI